MTQVSEVQRQKNLEEGRLVETPQPHGLTSFERVKLVFFSTIQNVNPLIVELPLLVLCGLGVVVRLPHTEQWILVAVCSATALLFNALHNVASCVIATLEERKALVITND